MPGTATESWGHPTRAIIASSVGRLSVVVFMRERCRQAARIASARPSRGTLRRAEALAPVLSARHGPPAAQIRYASGCPPRAAKGREQVIAGALAPAALLGRQTAVLMVMRVCLAPHGDGATRGRACIKRRELRVRVRVGLAAEDAASVNARVGAVEAQPDAASQLGDIGLGEARVGADRARRRARGALVDARRERGDVGDELTPMRSEDLFDAHVLSFGWMRFFQTITARAKMTIETATMP